jgi:pantoate--beta-alanine ligase
MDVVYGITELREKLKAHRSTRQHRVIGFIPTMGFLHEGHASLMKTAREQCDIVVLSIFVNPLQFGPNEDFERYPRDPEKDIQLAEASGVDLVFIPQKEEMYPHPNKTTVSVSGVTERLCGASRPGHFDGVATVVSKLFHIVQPDKAYFGLKDAQQVAVIQQMVNDLNMDVEIVPCPTLREPDGLAMSSRNVFLNETERKQALVISQALSQAESFIQNNSSFSASYLENLVRDHIQSAPLAVIDYVEVLEYPSLEPLTIIDRNGPISFIIAVAVKFGKTRLIDNLLIT